MNKLLKYTSSKIIYSAVILVCLCAILFYNSNLNNHSQNNNNNNNNNNTIVTSLSTLPVLHDGRIKPLDSFAKLTLKSIAKKDNLSGITASQWLINLLLNPHDDYNHRIFLITDSKLLTLLKLPARASNYYSFKEILPGIKLNIAWITQLQASKISSTPLSGSEKQILELYDNILKYFDLSRSLSLLRPIFDVKKLAASFDIDIKTNQTHISFYQLLPYKKIIASRVEHLYKSKKDLNTATNQDILTIANLFKNTESDKINTSLKIIPADGFLNTDHNNWLAPWEIIDSSRGTPNTAQYLNLLQEVIYQESLKPNLDKLNTFALQLAASYSKPALSSEKLSAILHTEVIYNNYKLFSKAIIFFSMSLILSIICLYSPNKINRFNTIALISRSLFTVGLLCNLIGIILRIFILQRPPVANLYESILFVSLITAVLCFVINLIRKDNIGTTLGSLICCVLLFIANSYDASGDSLGVVIAVLNNNFWLGTHVVAITSGYGSCLMLSAIAHVYLFCGLSYNISSEFKQKLQKYILAFGLLSLFLTLLGTILGGIWADQSWGRFWGWDPKENGALLICLWLIALIHGKISKQLSPIMFAAFAAMTSITVALAWFGVNLLSTGLHSYGFTENIALNLGMFIIFELFLTTLLTIFNKRVAL